MGNFMHISSPGGTRIEKAHTWNPKSMNIHYMATLKVDHFFRINKLVGHPLRSSHPSCASPAP